ncbi:YihY/virulence factor BrkB family protein [Pseudohongiella sp. SYSU M77423]|uniref:YihY/virulence factor BrkB family protein n=1 Tax=Pseudohongiella sp. SYSU M77423 TaxID=3042312 RepID=UPI0024802745|nr:YihY/virulence factor BrkB family protein [Pseudohongiella sp. SYSU M77423]MDH7944900.1 YihY/virulence factor BrkB family protein [Pseudohongiella sp. SYSU M77423]MEC8858391.1 YihY/virulence factor BrkB family protein [Pseudomonadota bacterium]
MQVRSLDDLKQYLDDVLWQDDPAANSSWRGYAMRAMRIGYAVIRDIAEGHLSLRAMSLVYYTVIAMVPLLALTFAVLKGLGVHNAMEPMLLGILQPFLGDYGQQITSNVVSFVDNVRVDVLSFVSLGVLLYTVLTMMQRIELAFNDIWAVSQARSLASRVSEYLFAVIVAPLLILLSVGIASYVNTNLFMRLLEGLAFGALILQALGAVMPLVFMSLAFALAFSFIPNTRVQFSSALTGGIVTTLAWKTMGWVFQNFITEYSANAIIYAAFFAVILLMLFIYLGWLMLLIGSSVAFYHQHPSKARTGRKPLHLSLQAQEELNLTVAYLIIKRFQQNEPPWTLDELLSYTQLGAPVLESSLATLAAIDFIRCTDQNPPRYLPSHSVDSTRIADLRLQLRTWSRDQLNTRSVVAEQIQIRRFLESVEHEGNRHCGGQTFTELMQEQHQRPRLSQHSQTSPTETESEEKP